MRASSDAAGLKMSLDSGKPKCPLVAELSTHVKENSRSGIVSCLTKIKSDQKCFQRLLDNGGVYLLVELLRYRNVKVLDATLSILANACLLPQTREEVQGTKIASYVVWIVKNLQSGETMHCRACRLMGNLSETQLHARALCEAGAIPALTETVSSKTNAQTLGMAVRAIRNIWSIDEGSREEILEAGTIRAITSVLVQSKKKLLERDDDAKYVELAESCLKAMYIFVAGTEARSSEQMRGEKDLHGYRCIVDCCRANNKIAIKCLYKLCRDAERRPDLGCSGAIECLVEVARDRCGSKARNSTSVSLSTSTWEILMSLCLFCREAVNRAKIRSASGLEAILGHLLDPNSEKYHPMLLSALAQFHRDDQSIAIMVKNGLIEVLVDKLKKMALETRVAEHAEQAAKNGKKRAAEMSPSMQGDAKYNRNDRFGRFSSDYPRYDWSPGGTSNGCFSPSSTPPLSPNPTSHIDENADDNYSPICSDNEWLDNDDTNETQDGTDLTTRIRGETEKDDNDGDFLKSEESENFQDNYEYVDDDENNDNSSFSIDESKEHASHVWTLSLLNILSCCSDPVEGLVDPTTIQALTGYIAAAKSNRASVILARIVGNRAYFVSLLLQGFIFEAQTLYGTDQYTKVLCELAETGGAFGELATLLLRGREAHRLIVALSIPLVIKNRERLRVLLNNHGGLELIFRVLSDSENTLYDEAILAISKLAVSLDVAPELRREKSDDTDNLAMDREYAVTDEKTDSSNVTFELDDGSTVEASRTNLCEKSEVFSAMLEGSFNEASQSRVRLKKASNDGFLTLLSAANGKNGSQLGRKIEALLDAVLLADQFLMPDVSDQLTETSIARLSHENLSKAWSWSHQNSCHELQVCCVKIFLTSTMTRGQRLQAFRDFSALPNFRDFVGDLKQIFAASLVPSWALNH